MKLYIECNMGLAGDMLAGALVDLFEDKQAITAELNGLGIPGVVFTAQPGSKCAIHGTHMCVEYNGQQEGHEHDEHHDHHHHHHVHLSDVKAIISSLNASEKVKKNACAVYDLLAEAEARVHGESIDNIHFHEVGTMDAIADITAVSYLLDRLNPEEIVVSPIHVGRGFVKCAHGILPVPAPATALLLEGIPSYSREIIEGELCTPTGAALARYYADSFGYQPLMKTTGIGYGLGNKDFPIANVVRAVTGESMDDKGRIVELDTNIDDMTGEEIAFATEEILKAGANEVFTTSVSMKKNRPGILLTVLCEEDRKEKILEVIFRNTTTLGIREVLKDRSFLKREISERETCFGRVRVKKSAGYGTEREKIEYEDLAEIARADDMSLLEVKKRINEK